MDLVLGVVTDLMFVVRIGEAAKKAGKRAIFVSSYDRAIAQADNNPALVIVDLANVQSEPEKTIREMKRRGIEVIAFGSHVDVQALKAAKEAGADRVLPRSRFVEDLNELLKSGAGWPGRNQATL